MNFKILFSTLAIVLIAGCVIPGLDTGGTILGGVNGIAITSFKAEPTEAYSGNTVRVTLEAQNLGGTTVDNRSVLVHLIASNANLNSNEAGSWHGKSAGNDKKEVRHFSRNLTPADSIKGTPANIEKITWNLVAPTITPGQKRVDSFTARLYSEYSSGVNGNIWVYNQSEAEATKTAGKALKTSSFTPVVGPVSINIKLSPDPVVLYPGENIFTFSIDVTNSGTGVVYKTGAINLAIDSPSFSLDTDSQLHWISVSVNTNNQLTIADCTGDQQISGGRSMTLVCTATIPSSYSVSTFRSFPVNVMAKYGYYIDGETSVTVQGRTVTTSPECTTNAQCDDSNDCTTDACSSQKCTHTNLPDGTECQITTTTTGICESGICGPP